VITEEREIDGFPDYRTDVGTTAVGWGKRLTMALRQSLVVVFALGVAGCDGEDAGNGSDEESCSENAFKVDTVRMILDLTDDDRPAGAVRLQAAGSCSSDAPADIMIVAFDPESGELEFSRGLTLTGEIPARLDATYLHWKRLGTTAEIWGDDQPNVVNVEFNAEPIQAAAQCVGFDGVVECYRIEIE